MGALREPPLQANLGIRLQDFSGGPSVLVVHSV
jgi:hypothetical protein